MSEPIKPGSYVTRGSGVQLARYIKPERKYSTDGHRIMPLNNGQAGDGYGMPTWTDRVTPVAVEQWGPVTGAPGTEVRWYYSAASNAYRKEYRKL